jgi:AcrR family transcriptional regulator
VQAELRAAGNRTNGKAEVWQSIMVNETEVRDSTQRVLDVAEGLFIDRGYHAITLRDIADELGIKQASLYYHFPGGKEELFHGDGGATLRAPPRGAGARAGGGRR